MKVDIDPQRRCFRGSAFVVGSILLVAIALDSSPIRAQVDPSNDYLLPPVAVQELFDRDKNLAELDRISPNGSHFLIPLSDELSSLELMARRTLRLGMLELMPEVDREWRLATYGIRGYDVYALEERRRWSIDVPEGSFVSDAIWSPDGSRLAFLAHLTESTQVWTADVNTGAAELLSDARVMATLAARGGAGVPSRMLQWMPDGSVLALLVPTDRGSEPEVDPVPTGPVVRRTREEATPTRTLPFLLRSEYDADLFRYYTTAQLTRLSSGQAPQPIGDPAMYLSIALSPDGRHILAEQLVEPFSYIVGYTSFGRNLNVLNLDGDVVSTIRQIPLYESSGRDNRPAANLPREVTWRPDGRGLSWLARTPKVAEEGDDTGDTEQQDRVMGVEAPFVVVEAKELTSTEGRFSDLLFDASGDHFFAEITEDGERTLFAYDMSVEPAAGQVLVSYDPDNVLELPGEMLTRQDGNGITTVVMSSNGQSAYLRGSGYGEQFTPQPFVDRVEIANGTTCLLYTSPSPRD